MNWKQIVRVSVGGLIGLVIGRLLVSTLTLSWTVTMALFCIAGGLTPEIIAWFKRRKIRGRSA